MVDDAHAAFVDKWVHPDFRPKVPTEHDLLLLESELNSRIPTEYRSFILRFGPVSPDLALLSNIVEQGLALNSLGDFLPLHEIPAVTRDWRTLGLSDMLFAFATDASGSLFCFSVCAPVLTEQPNGEVWFFDHDAGESESLHVTFSEWVARYAGVEKIVA